MADSNAITSRGMAALIASLVADAAANPGHWIYDPAKLAAHMKESPSVGFCKPPARKHFTTPEGHFTCYGDQVYLLLQSLVAMRGFDAADYASRLAERYGKDGPYEVKATDPENWPRYKADVFSNLPLEGPWRHGSIQDFLANYVTKEQKFPDCGSATDTLIDHSCRVVPIVALYAGHEALLPTCEQVIRVTQNNDAAVAHGCAFARMLEARILGKATSSSEARLQTIKALKDPERKFITPMDDTACQRLEEVQAKYGEMSTAEVGALLQPEGAPPNMGLNCHLPQAFVLPLHVAEAQKDYKAGVEAAILVGGTSASRSMLVGALLGVDSEVPEEWLKQSYFGSDVVDLCKKLEAIRADICK